MGPNPQKGSTINKEDEIPIKDEENANENFPEKQVQPETTNSGVDDEPTEMSKNEEATNTPIRESKYRSNGKNLAHQPESTKSPIDEAITSRFQKLSKNPCRTKQAFQA